MISDQYRALNAALHKESWRYGASGGKHIKLVRELVDKYKAESVIDYGCGKGGLKDAAGGSPKIINYDPSIEEHNKLPDPADIVVCFDVMEHVEEEFVDEVLDHIKSLAKKAAYFVIVFHLAKKSLPDGRNTHICIHPKEWWEEKLTERFQIVDTFISEKGEGWYECASRG